MQQIFLSTKGLLECVRVFLFYRKWQSSTVAQVGKRNIFRVEGESPGLSAQGRCHIDYFVARTTHNGIPEMWFLSSRTFHLRICDFPWIWQVSHEIGRLPKNICRKRAPCPKYTLGERDPQTGLVPPLLYCPKQASHPGENR